MKVNSKLILSEITLEELEITLSDKIASRVVSLVKPLLNNEEEVLLTRGEVAKMLKVSLPTISKYQKQGILKPQGFGRPIRFLKSHVLNMKFRKTIQK